MKRRISNLILAGLIISSCGLAQDKQASRAAKIHNQIFTVDSHNDTPMRFGDTTFNMAERHDSRKGGGKIDFVRMKEGGLDGAFFAVFVGQGPLTPEGRDNAYKRALKTFDDIFKTAEKNKATAGLAFNPGDGYKLEKEDRRVIYIGIENGYPVGLELGRVQEFYNLGARYITLCHSRNNDICDSSTDPSGPVHNGLSDFGRQVVGEMNRLGIMVDVSHLSDKSFFDVIETGKVPVIASHSCARALCDNPRNLSDDMIRALAKNGGVIQTCILSGYVKAPEPNPEREAAEKTIREKYGNWENLTPEQMRQARGELNALRQKYPEKLATVSDMVDHIDHIVRIAGINHVGIGTDFDGGGGLADCYDSSEMGNITLELVNRGYTKNQIRKIWSGNLFRVMNEVESYAKK
jgi:membrane dipeptidase